MSDIDNLIGVPPNDAADKPTPDPFSAAEAPGVQLIVQMRMYDVLLGIYTELNPVAADALIELHAQGKVIGPIPSFRLADESPASPTA